MALVSSCPLLLLCLLSLSLCQQTPRMGRDGRPLLNKPQVKVGVFIHVENRSSSCLCARSDSSTRSTADTTISSGKSFIQGHHMSSSLIVQLSLLLTCTVQYRYTSLSSRPPVQLEGALAHL